MVLPASLTFGISPANRAIKVPQNARYQCYKIPRKEVQGFVVEINDE